MSTWAGRRGSGTLAPPPGPAVHNHWRASADPGHTETAAPAETLPAHWREKQSWESDWPIKHNGT